MFRYVLILLLLPVPLFSENLEESIVRILNEHPAAKASDYKKKAANERADYDRFRYPDPEVSAAWINRDYQDTRLLPIPEVNKSSIDGYELAVTQPVPFPGKYTAMAGESKSNAKAETQRDRIRKNLIIERYIRSLAELEASEEKLRFTNQFSNTLATFAGIARVRYSAGRASLVDVSLSRSIAANYRQKSEELKAIVQEKKLDADYFRQSSGLSHKSLYSEIDPYLKSKGRSGPVSIDQLPAVRYEIAKREAAESKLTASKLQYLPDMGVFAAAGRNNIQMLSGRGSESSFRAGIKITVPLWSGLSNHNQVSGASNNKLAGDQEVQDTIQSIQREISSLDEKIKAGEKRLQILSSVSVPSALTAYRSALTSYRAGTVDISSAISAFDAYYEASISRSDLKAELRIWKAARLALIDRILPEDSNEN